MTGQELYERLGAMTQEERQGRVIYEDEHAGEDVDLLSLQADVSMRVVVLYA